MIFFFFFTFQILFIWLEKKKEYVQIIMSVT